MISHSITHNDKRNIEQLSLFDVPAEERKTPAQPEPQPAQLDHHIEVHSVEDEHENPSSELDLLTYTYANLKHHGQHDNARREWLRNWAVARGYKTFLWVCHGKYDGYTGHRIPDGEANWQHFRHRLR